MPPFGFSDTFEVAPGNSWQTPSPAQIARPDFADDEAKKKLFGIELAKAETPLNAAKSFFNDDAHAMWAIKNWLNDPVVVASKDVYLKTLDDKETLLDKEGLAALLLRTSQEKTPNGFYQLEAKERINALRLYADIMGFTKPLIDMSKKTFNYNEMRVTFVEPSNENDAPKVSNAPVIDHGEIQNSNDGVKIKLVG